MSQRSTISCRFDFDVSIRSEQQFPLDDRPADEIDHLDHIDSLLSCLTICSRISSSPVTTMVMRETVAIFGLGDRQARNIVPLLENRFAMRDSAPCGFQPAGKWYACSSTLQHDGAERFARRNHRKNVFILDHHELHERRPVDRQTLAQAPAPPPTTCTARNPGMP